MNCPSCSCYLEKATQFNNAFYICKNLHCEFCGLLRLDVLSECNKVASSEINSQQESSGILRPDDHEGGQPADTISAESEKE